MPLKFRRRAVLVKPEATYGVDPIPTGAANAIQLADVTISPMEGQEVERNLVGRSIGEQAKILVGLHVALEATIELTGAGAAGTVPAYGPMLRACAFSETVQAGVDVVYQPVSVDEESVAVYFNLDGNRHVLLGARGTSTIRVAGSDFPKATIRLVGLWSTPAAAAYPTPDFSAFQTPLPVTRANTPTFTLHGHAGVMHSLEIAQNNELVHRDLVNDESVVITDRGFAGTAVIDAPALAAQNFFAAAEAQTLAALQLVHGTAAGAIVQIDAPRVQIGRPSYGDARGAATLSLPVWLIPNAGDDEITLTIK
ncbi:MAG: phage tail tube protein [Alphaproteobacteria bacterium]|nr:phage tail tube protein [Alphaproteobacteria bacterium]